MPFNASSVRMRSASAKFLALRAALRAAIAASISAASSIAALKPGLGVLLQQAHHRAAGDQLALQPRLLRRIARLVELGENFVERGDSERRVEIIIERRFDLGRQRRVLRRLRGAAQREIEAVETLLGLGEPL